MNNNDLLPAIVNEIKSLRKRVDELESQPGYSYVIKTTTGDPATGRSGQFIENTFDNTLKVWADGAWRQIASW